MKRAFLFDMDGVIVDSEREWQINGSDFPRQLYGNAIADAMGDTTGTSLDFEYAFAKERGFAMPLDEFYQLYDKQAEKMYAFTHISEGTEDLVRSLKEMGFLVGIVSSSRRYWIDIVLQKLTDPHLFDYIISLNQEGLPSKPDPAGYRRAMEDLGVTPHNTIVLEDSNHGIQAARRSGAYVIGYTGNLIKGYIQTEKANAVVRTMREVLPIVKRRVKQ